jgi:hypothetical protein
VGAAPQAEKFGGRRRAERERERERAEPSRGAKAEDQITPPPLEGGGEGAVPDLLALLSAFCAAGQPKVGAAPQAEKIWWPSDKLRGRGRESRAKPELGLRTRLRPP